MVGGGAAQLLDAYDFLGEAAEAAHHAVADASPERRWSAVCEAARHWALGHPVLTRMLAG